MKLKVLREVKFTMRKLTKRILLTICLAALMLESVFLVHIFFSPTRPVCYFDHVWNDGKTLKSFDKNPKLHRGAKNIFFHETSCTEDGIIRLTSRQACAIESAARMNPNREAFVLFASQVGFRNSTPLPIIDALASYPNIHFNYLNLTHYAENTPLESWLDNKKLYRSVHLVSHTSDVLRYLSLWKFGGTYFDLDTVSLKPIDSLKPNFAAAMDGCYVAVGIINVEGEVGHKFAGKFIKELSSTFDGNHWGNNGPGVMTRVLVKACNTKDTTEMVECDGFHVLPVESSYTIRWREAEKFFQPEYRDDLLDRLNESTIAHVWNKLTADHKLTVDSDVAYVHLARKNCPKVLQASKVF